jgi:aryl-alcohol dehydrogenase-like predicted oxidoreductase
MTFGEAAPGQMMHGIGATDAESWRMMDAALEAGVNFIDTADVYGDDGLSERVIGRWFQQRGRRNDVVLATKFRFRMYPGPLGTGASRRRIVEACDASLKRLQTDYIDLYQIHMQDLRTPEAETLRALDDLVTQGKIRYYGCSNYAAYRLVESDWIADKRGWAGFATLQAQYNLLERNLEREHTPYMRRHGMGMLPWSPLASGLLTGKYRQGQKPPPGTRLEKWKERLAGVDERKWRIIEAVVATAEEIGSTPTAVSLAWLLTRPTVCSVIIGARNVDQLADNLAGAALKLPAEAVKKLDEVSAPELGYPYDFLQRVDGDW